MAVQPHPQVAPEPNVSGAAVAVSDGAGGGARFESIRGDELRLVLFDLDNTLIDRAGAFRAWACAFAEQHGLPAGEAEWMERADADGLASRTSLFEQARSRFGLGESVDDLIAAYRREYPGFVQPPAGETLTALRTLRGLDWRIGIVSNGAPTQEAKIVAAGLADIVDGWAISEVVGVRKPDPGIFEAAAAACGCTLEGGWLVGDSATADIAGALACGLRSVWISRGRNWEASDYRPDATSASVAEAVTQILASS